MTAVRSAVHKVLTTRGVDPPRNGSRDLSPDDLSAQDSVHSYPDFSGIVA